MTKKQKLLILIITSIVVAIILYTIPKDMEKFYTGYLYSRDDQVSELVEIKVKGKLYPKILSDNYFDGEIIFDNEALPLRSSLPRNMKVSLKGMKDKIRKKGMLLLIIKYENRHVNTHGGVRVSRDFNEIWGNVKNLNKKYKDIGLKFAAPATNEEEANVVGCKFVSQH